MIVIHEYSRGKSDPTNLNMGIGVIFENGEIFFKKAVVLGLLWHAESKSGLNGLFFFCLTQTLFINHGT